MGKELLSFVREDVVKRLWITIKFFTQKRVMDMAAALTYSTLLAIVPILAVVFAIARGFGYSKYIEVWFRETLSSQPLVAETIIGFVNSYLIHTKSGIFLGIGLIFMLWTVLMLTSNVERTFNAIWQVKHPRGLFRTITDYLAIFFLMPIVLVVVSGLSIFLATIAGDLDEWFVIGPMMRFTIAAMPYILMSAVFVGLYVFMPNIKVKFSAALIPGILAGVAMQLLQVFYIHAQIFLSSYNAIYGSFAALPMFMLWVQFSWTICLFGAELSYTNQNLEDLTAFTRTEDLSHRYRLMLSALLMSKICKRFDEGRKPYTALELKLETGIPSRITQELLYELQQVNMVSVLTDDSKDAESQYQPAESLSHQTVGVMIDRLESLGTWKLDINLKEQLDGLKWSEFYALRKNYLSSLRDIQLKEL